MDLQTMKNSLPRRERRLIEGATELRTDEGAGAAPKIGMRIPFGKRSHDMGFIEIIDPGAFDKTLAERGSDVVALWNHDPLWVLGRQSNRTLKVKVTDGALEGEATLDGDDTMHRHFAGRVKRGDVIGSSFGFNTIRDSWEEDREAGTILRTLLEVRLFDLSPVTYPAYPESEAEARALGDTRLVELAATRGIDPLEFVRVMASSTSGKVEQRHLESLNRWIGVLEAMRPDLATEVVDAAVPLELRRRKLDMLSKRHGLSAA